MVDQLQIPGFLTDERLVLSVAFIVVVMVLRWLLVRMIRGGREIISDVRRAWITQVRNGAFAFIMVGLVFVWLPEIETFAFSIAAVAVAFVIATKELILCISGTVYRAGSNIYRVGDWVQIGPHFGEVVDHDWGSTTLQYVDPDEYVRTGATITIPNGTLLTQPVVNRNFLKNYVFHSFTLTIEPDGRLVDAIPVLRAVIEAHSTDFIDVARRYNSMVERQTGVDIPDPEPRFRIASSDLAKPVLRVTFFCPRDRAVDLQNRVTEAFWDWYADARAVAG